MQLTWGVNSNRYLIPNRHRTETASTSARDQSSATRPAITDGVVTSFGVFGSTVVK